MTENSTKTRTVREHLVDIQHSYEQSKGISGEDLNWLLVKVEQALEMGESAKNLASVARILVDTQDAEIARLTKELAKYEG